MGDIKVVHVVVIADVVAATNVEHLAQKSHEFVWVDACYMREVIFYEASVQLDKRVFASVSFTKSKNVQVYTTDIYCLKIYIAAHYRFLAFRFLRISNRCLSIL